MYTNDRYAYRDAYFQTFEKWQRQLPLDDMEKQLVAVIEMHPEYHALFSAPKQSRTQEFTLEENPFFHLSLHLAIFDQLKLDKPTGIREIFLAAKHNGRDEHEVLHQMMGCLAEMLARMERDGKVVEDQIYLERLKMVLV